MVGGESGCVCVGGVKQEKEKNSLVCSIPKRGEKQPQITLAGT